MSKIVLVTTGGTVASRHDPKSGHTAASVDGDSLRQSLHDPLTGVDLVVDEFCNVGSFAIDLPLAFGLAKRVERHLADPAYDRRRGHTWHGHDGGERLSG